MKENRILLAVVAVTGGIFFWTLTGGKKTPSGAVPLNRLSSLEVAEVQVDSSTGTYSRVRLHREEDSYGEGWWFEEHGRSVRRYVANLDVDILLDRVTPLSAKRTLGQRMAERLKEILLDPPLYKVSITDRAGRTDVFHVGDRTIRRPGADRYLRRPESTEVFLVGPEVVEDFLPPHRYRQGLFVQHLADEMERVTVRANGRTEVFYREKARRSEEAFWTRARERDRRAKDVDEFVTQIYRMRVLDYVSDPPPESELTPVLEAEWLSDEQTSEVVILKKHAEGDALTYYGRSRATRGTWGTIFTAIGKRIERQIERVMKR